MNDFLTYDEERKVLETINNETHKLIVLLMLDAGCRVSEAISLTWEDCNFRKKEIKIFTLKKGKNKTKVRNLKRSIPMTERLFNQFVILADNNKVDSLSGFIFPNRTDGHIARNSVNMFLFRLQDHLPTISKLNPHKFRHTFATKLRAANNTLEDVKDLLGHDSLKNTFIYAHQTEEAKKQAIKTLQPKLTLTEKIKEWLKPKPKHFLNVSLDGNFLIGRDQESSHLVKSIGRFQNTLITGPAGVGKSHLLDSLHFDKKVLLIDDVKDLKKSLQNMIIWLCDGDKEEIARLLFKDISHRETRLSRESTTNLVRTLIDITERQEYILKIENIDHLTQSTANIVKLLKEHFVIITTAKAVAAKFIHIFSDFERIQLEPLNRKNSYILINRFLDLQNLTEGDSIITKIYEASQGLPQAIKELCERLSKEQYISIESCDDICSNYLGRGVHEIDMSIVLLLVLGGFAILRYYGRESGEKDLQFIGGAIMIVMLFARYFFNGMKRTRL